MSIGGNVEALIQTRSESGYNSIGERVNKWVQVDKIKGYNDYLSGTSDKALNAKIQDTTHVFVCDYKPLNFTSDNARMIIDENVYEILMIDDPMNLHDHIEIYLRYVGVGQDAS